MVKSDSGLTKGNRSGDADKRTSNISPLGKIVCGFRWTGNKGHSLLRRDFKGSKLSED